MRLHKKRILLMAIDAAIVVAVSIGLQLLALFGPSSLMTHSPIFSGMTWLATAVVAVTVLFFRSVTGVYRCIWRYVGITNYLRVVLADAIAEVFLTLFFALVRFGFGFTTTALIVLLSCLEAVIISCGETYEPALPVDAVIVLGATSPTLRSYCSGETARKQIISSTTYVRAINSA